MYALLGHLGNSRGLTSVCWLDVDRSHTHTHTGNLCVGAHVSCAETPQFLPSASPVYQEASMGTISARVHEMPMPIEIDSTERGWPVAWLRIRWCHMFVQPCLPPVYCVSLLLWFHGDCRKWNFWSGGKLQFFSNPKEQHNTGNLGSISFTENELRALHWVFFLKNNLFCFVCPTWLKCQNLASTSFIPNRGLLLSFVSTFYCI